jgi:hypothetical protein
VGTIYMTVQATRSSCSFEYPLRSSPSPSMKQCEDWRVLMPLNIASRWVCGSDCSTIRYQIVAQALASGMPGRWAMGDGPKTRDSNVRFLHPSERSARLFMLFSCPSFWETLSEPTRHWHVSYPPQRPSQRLTGYLMIVIGAWFMQENTWHSSASTAS